MKTDETTKEQHPPSTQAAGSDDPLMERRKCDRCQRDVTVLDWSYCGHPNCYAFFRVIPVVNPNEKGQPQPPEADVADTKTV